MEKLLTFLTPVTNFLFSYGFLIALVFSILAIIIALHGNRLSKKKYKESIKTATDVKASVESQLLNFKKEFNNNEMLKDALEDLNHYRPHFSFDGNSFTLTMSDKSLYVKEAYIITRGTEIKSKYMISMYNGYCEYIDNASDVDLFVYCQTMLGEKILYSVLRGHPAEHCHRYLSTEGNFLYESNWKNYALSTLYTHDFACDYLRKVTNEVLTYLDGETNQDLYRLFDENKLDACLASIFKHLRNRIYKKSLKDKEVFKCLVDYLTKEKPCLNYFYSPTEIDYYQKKLETIGNEFAQTQLAKINNDKSFNGFNYLVAYSESVENQEYSCDDLMFDEGLRILENYFKESRNDVPLPNEKEIVDGLKYLFLSGELNI